MTGSSQSRNKSGKLHQLRRSKPVKSGGHLAGVAAAAAGPAAVLAAAGAVARARMDRADGWHALPPHDQVGRPTSSVAATVRVNAEQVRERNNKLSSCSSQVAEMRTGAQ